jgi:dephospho-CoA kinase
MEEKKRTMGAWPGKFVIGLTGNIATGKSVVRKMLEHLGAYGIDADALGHRAIARGAPGYRQVLAHFGTWVVGADGEIDRSRLGRIVFSDPQALAHLESIVHPLVTQAVGYLASRSQQKVVVIEAIKLIESGLKDTCDSLWTTYSPVEMQVDRLVEKRGMTRETALQRINAQPPQEEKIAAADVVIHNTGSMEDTWKQVAAAWQKLFPETQEEAEPFGDLAGSPSFSVQRAIPRQAEEIAGLINRLSGGQRQLFTADVMAAFGDKAFMLLLVDGKAAGVAGWKVENLVARTNDVYIDPELPFAATLKSLMDEVERASRELECEASLLFLPEEISHQDEIIQMTGYQPRSVQSLTSRAWKEAALESKPPGTIMLFKKLRRDRVLRPV